MSLFFFVDANEWTEWHCINLSHWVCAVCAVWQIQENPNVEQCIRILIYALHLNRMHSMPEFPISNFQVISIYNCTGNFSQIYIVTMGISNGQNYHYVPDWREVKDAIQYSSELVNKYSQQPPLKSKCCRLRSFRFARVFWSLVWFGRVFVVKMSPAV